MGKKGKTLTQKRISAPPIWRIPRKAYKFAPRTIPGPHKKDRSIPLQIILRDMLGYGLTRNEVKKILSKRYVAVDGRVRIDPRYPVGFMDVLTIIPNDEYYRIIPAPDNRIFLHPIDKKEAKIKPCFVKGKHTVKGGHIQLTLHDGRNILIKVKDPKKPLENGYKTHDTLVITIPEQKIKKRIPFKEGVIALVVAGKNMGYVGKIVDIRLSISSHANVVELELSDGRRIETTMDYIFPIGIEKPVISLPEVLIQ